MPAGEVPGGGVARATVGWKAWLVDGKGGSSIEAVRCRITNAQATALRIASRASPPSHRVTALFLGPFVGRFFIAIRLDRFPS